MMPPRPIAKRKAFVGSKKKARKGLRSTSVPSTPSAEDLLIGILAVMANQGHRTLRINDASFHRSFGAALSVFRDSSTQLADLAKRFHRDAVSRTYSLLDDALIAAEHYGLVKIYNPSFEYLDIHITAKEATQLLADWERFRDVFETAAAALRSAARRDSTCS